MATNKPISSPDVNEALRQTQRLLAWSAYQDALKDVDQKTMQQFQLTVAHLRAALWVKAGTYIVQFVILGLVLFLSLREALQTKTGEPLWAWGVSLFSLLMLAILLIRNPIQTINSTLVDLARVQVILQGYNRQINQVDAIFKQAFLEDKVDLGNVSKYLDHIQKVIEGNTENLLQILDNVHL